MKAFLYLPNSMFKRDLLNLKSYDWFIIFSILILSFFGLVALYTLSLGKEDFLNFKKQLLFFLIGLFLFFLFASINYRYLKFYSFYLYILFLLIFLLLFIFGKTIRGATSWFHFGILSFQPVEFFKIIFILVLAGFFSKGRHFSEWGRIVGSAFLLFVPLILILIQPDFGSALILFLVWLGEVFFLKIRFFKLVFVLFIIFSLLFSSWFFLKDYQKERLITFLNPSADPLGRGYNISQAMIAVGSGGFWGKGLGEASQSQLRFLPASQTDFIFAVLAEEFGFFGIFFLLSFFLLLLYRIKKVGERVKNDFSLFLILGVWFLLFFEVFVNLGVNLGLLPVTGITLPFVSYGGSSLLSHFILLGIVENIIKEGYV